MKLPQDFKELLAALARFEVEFIIIGGYAFAFHVEPRATKDLDILVASTPGNQERLALALTDFGLPAHLVASVRSQSLTEVVYFGKAPLRVDLLRAIDGVDTVEIFRRAISTSVDGVDVHVIDRESLIANKRAAGRARDLADVEQLESIDKGSSRATD